MPPMLRRLRRSHLPVRLAHDQEVGSDQLLHQLIRGDLRCGIIRAPTQGISQAGSDFLDRRGFQCWFVWHGWMVAWSVRTIQEHIARRFACITVLDC